MIWSVMILRKL